MQLQENIEDILQSIQENRFMCHSCLLVLGLLSALSTVLVFSFNLNNQDFAWMINY